MATLLEAISKEQDRLTHQSVLLGKLLEIDMGSLFEDLDRVMGDQAIRWLLERCRALGDSPINLLIAGDVDNVRRTVLAIEYGVYL